MKAVDTNVLARLIVQDDPQQLLVAAALIENGISVSLTVLLELGWLLRSRYGYDRTRISRSVIELMDNPRIHVSECAAVRRALKLYDAGADFADVIHLVAARGTEAFVTFDRNVPDGSTLDIAVEHIG